MTLNTGHPVIGINRCYGDADDILREWAQKKFNCPEEMVSDPNGSEHVVRGPESIDFAFYWNADCSGKLFIRVTGKTSPDSQMKILFGDHFYLTDANSISEEEFSQSIRSVKNAQ